MKTRTAIYLFISALLCVACVKNPGNANDAKTVDIGAIESLVDYQIPVKANYATIVTQGDDTLAITTQAMTVQVPRRALAAGEIKTTYSDEEMYSNFGETKYWQYISFEDTRSADYDYNDLVIHCAVTNSRVGDLYEHNVYVQPVALGSSVKIALGILYKADPNGELLEAMLADDVRATLYNGNPTFPINTDPDKERKQVSRIPVKLFSTRDANPQIKVVWFIETAAAGRLYAATTNFDADKRLDMVSKDGLPYGISLASKWDYPIEKCPIWEAYPNFHIWIKEGNETTLKANSVSDKKFPASPPKNTGLDDLWDYDRGF